MQQANLTSEWLNYRLDEASSNAVDGMGNVIAPDTNRADGASLAVAAVGAQDVFGLSGGGLTPGPVPIADDTFDQRTSLSAMGTGCPWEGLGRSCVVAVVGRKGKTKRRT